MCGRKLHRWKVIPGYEEYSVSCLGRVKHNSGRILTPQNYAYIAIFLRKDKKQSRFLVHKLVMDTFVGPCPAGMEVNHKDGNKHNNRSDNLEYVTHSGNMAHAYANDLMSTREGSSNPFSKLNESIVRKIRKTHATGLYTRKMLAKQFGISPSTVKSVVNRYSWQHVE